MGTTFKKFKINKKRIFWKKVAEQYYIFDKKKNEFYSLNQTASFIWEKICEGINSLQELENLFFSSYQSKVDKSILQKDFNKFLSQLKRKEFIV